jgi:hypothetical protein
MASINGAPRCSIASSISRVNLLREPTGRPAGLPLSPLTKGMASSLDFTKTF